MIHKQIQYKNPKLNKIRLGFFSSLKSLKERYVGGVWVLWVLGVVATTLDWGQASGNGP